MITLTIDGKKVGVERSVNIVEAAKTVGIKIPTLCYHERLSHYGGCRICLVEIEKNPKLQTACTTPVANGMVVHTESETVKKARRGVLEFLLINHPLDCLVCDKGGECDLQDLTYRYGVTESRYREEKRKIPANYEDHLIVRIMSRCVHCLRCVRVCDEVQGLGALAAVSRGGHTIIEPFSGNIFNCEYCGSCVAICPTGSLQSKKFLYKARPWQIEREVDTICAYCGVGCSLTLQVRDEHIVRVISRENVGVNNGNLCVKGRFGYDFVNSKDRLVEPLIRVNDKLVPATWEETLSLVAKRLLEIKDKFGPDSIGGFSSAKCTNEENYLFQKFMRAAIGTNNVDNCTRLCHSSSTVGLVRAFGTGAATGSMAEIPDSDVIFIIGSNITETHPVIGIKIRKAARSGVKLIVADPRKIALTRFATIWMRHRPGTDVALLNGMMHVIIKEGLLNRDFIKDRTENYEAMDKVVKDYTPAVASRITGVPADDIVKAARIYGSAKAAGIHYAMGVTQHTTGVDKVLAIANLAMLTEQIGREGAGVNPLRGQNNVQGACDMGALPDVYPGYQPVNIQSIRRKFEETWGVSLSDRPGLTGTEMVNAIDDGKIRALYIMGENPMLSDPDTNHTRKALEKLDFLVVQDIFLSETAELADVILPAVSFAEKEGTFTNTDRRIQRVRKAINPIGNSWEDLRIIGELSKKIGYPMEYSSASEVMDEIAMLTPIYGGISYIRLEKDALQWPCPTSDHPGTKILHKGKFTRGLGKFHPVEYKVPVEEVDSEYPLILTTGRWLFQYHTGTMTRRARGIDEIAPEAFVEINPVDAERYGIKDMEVVKAISRRGEIRIRAKVTDKSPAGTVFIPFHFWEAAANVLTINALDPLSKIPEYKVCAVKVEPLP